MWRNPITAIVVGAGHRALRYARYAQAHPDEMRIVGVADPDPVRRRHLADTYDLSEAQCFASADAVINGTMDAQHVPTSLPLLEAGYDILLEKPFAQNEDQMRQLVSAARRRKRTVMVCHVLRYAPFYAAIRRKVADDVIGTVMNMQTVEHVSYHHMSVGFVRGKWRRRDECGSSMLLSKCCHDMDLLAWMKSGVAPVSVAAFGGLMYFRPEHAPANSGTRCLVDCPIEATCPYSARKLYLDHPRRWAAYVWASLEHLDAPTIEDKIASLKGDNPHGRCMWKCDNDVVDHQSLAVEFADGATATHNLVGGAAKPSRTIHLVGTHGEIQGALEDESFVVRRSDPRAGHEYSEERFDLRPSGDLHGAFGGHAGGDLRLVADFVRLLRGEPRSLSCTAIEDSIHGHQIVFAADRSVEQGAVAPIPNCNTAKD